MNLTIPAKSATRSARTRPTGIRRERPRSRPSSTERPIDSVPLVLDKKDVIQILNRTPG